VILAYGARVTPQLLRVTRCQNTYQELTRILDNVGRFKMSQLGNLSPVAYELEFLQVVRSAQPGVYFPWGFA
jgi:hypothetical protein